MCLLGVSTASISGADWWCGAIVLEVFGQVGLVVGELRNFELVSVVGEHCWSADGVDIFL